MRLIIFLLLAAFLNSCSTKEPLYHSQHYVFGTLVDISIYGETDVRASQAANDIIQQYTQLHQRLHAWKPSEITAINQALAAGKSIVVAPDIANILKHAAHLSTQSDGLFNPTIGQLVKTWGFHDDQFVAKTINHATIKKLVAANPQLSDIKIENNIVSSHNPAVQLDLGGYAKGYALDIGIKHLQTKGIQHALINIGGNIIALGQHGEKPWMVGIQHPRQPNAIAKVALPSGWAIGTSGDYQRYYILENKRYCHIIHPHTGYPIQQMQSVTVMIPPQVDAGTLSDVLSKPLFISTKEARLKLASKLEITHFLMIENNNQIQISKDMENRIEWLVKPRQASIEVVNIDEK